MFGKNQILAPTKGSGDQLNIVSIFHTIQGEGPFAGEPAIFIRLGGCNLACTFCDTEFDEYQNWELNSIITKVDEISNHTKLIVITGGEPFRQPINALCIALLEKNYRIQIETNGTIYREVPSAVHIVCSPKNTGQGYKKIRPDLLKNINAFKFIISKSNPDYNHIPEIGQSEYNLPTYIQPMDEYDTKKNRDNQEFVTNLAIKHNVLISLQLHKILGIE